MVLILVGDYFLSSILVLVWNRRMIKVAGVEKAFGRTAVLRGTDLEIPTGETMVIMAAREPEKAF